MLSKVIEKYRVLPSHMRAAFWFLVCAFMQKASGAIITPILSRVFSPAEYGQYSVFYSWLDIVTVFATLELYAGVYTQGIIKFESNKNVFSASLQGLSTTLVLIWVAVYLCFHEFWNRLLSLSTVQMLAMFLMIWSTSAYMFWYEEQRAEYNYQKIVALTAFISIASPLIGVLCTKNAKDKVTAWILGILIVHLIGYIGPYLTQMLRGKTFFNKKFWVYAITFNVPLIPHYLSQKILNSSDRIMIEKMVGSAEAGVYSIAYTVAQTVTLFSIALNQTIGPWLYKKIRDKNVENISRIAYPAIILISALNIGFIAFAPEVISIFAPQEYYEAIWVIPPVAMSVNFLFIYIFFANFEFYFEKTRYISIATIGGAILNIILNYFFIKRFGYYAAGYTTLFCYFLYTFFHYCSMRKICNQYLNGVKVYDLRILAVITAVFLLVGFLMMLTYNATWLRYSVILVMIGMIIVCRKYIINILRNLLYIQKRQE